MSHDDIRARLAALPAHLTVEPHGTGEAVYSMRDQPINPDMPTHCGGIPVNVQHGWQVAFVADHDRRLWPAVRAFLEHGPADMAALLAENERLREENERLREERNLLVKVGEALCAKIRAMLDGDSAVRESSYRRKPDGSTP